MVLDENPTMHTPPTDIEIAVETAKGVKHNLNRMFEHELLSQIAKFLNNCNPCWLSQIDGCPIKLKAQLVESPTAPPKIVTKVIIGDVSFTISPDDLMEKGLIDYSTTHRPFRITPEDIFNGLLQAYHSLVSKLDKNNEKIAGLSLQYRIFGEPRLVLSI